MVMLVFWPPLPDPMWTGPLGLVGYGGLFCMVHKILQPRLGDTDPHPSSLEERVKVYVKK